MTGSVTATMVSTISAILTRRRAGDIATSRFDWQRYRNAYRRQDRPSHSGVDLSSTHTPSITEALVSAPPPMALFGELVRPPARIGPEDLTLDRLDFGFIGEIDRSRGARRRTMSGGRAGRS